MVFAYFLADTELPESELFMKADARSILREDA